jgi:hypothetical protein
VKQGVGSTIHCVAGDATGIILAAVVTASLGLPMWIDLIVEYIAGFSFGLFIFQSLFMKRTMGGTYWENVRKSFMPEFISMNAMMAGMAPTLSFGRDRGNGQRTPDHARWDVLVQSGAIATDSAKIRAPSVRSMCCRTIPCLLSGACPGCSTSACRQQQRQSSS